MSVPAVDNLVQKNDVSVSHDWIMSEVEKLIADDHFVVNTVRYVFDCVVSKICPSCGVDLKEKAWLEISPKCIEAASQKFRSDCCSYVERIQEKEKIQRVLVSNKSVVMSFVMKAAEADRKQMADRAASFLRRNNSSLTIYPIKVVL